MKQCTKCSKYDTEDNFYKNKIEKDGLAVWCKFCLKIYRQSDKGKEAHRKYKKTDQGKKANKRSVEIYKQTEHGRQAIVARQAVHQEIRVGKMSHISEKECYYCGKQAMEYHHYDGYKGQNKLAVLPICKTCHRQIH